MNSKFVALVQNGTFIRYDYIPTFIFISLKTLESEKREGKVIGLKETVT